MEAKQDTLEELDSSDKASDVDEELDKAALGETGTSDAIEDGTGEVDAIGKAAGMVVRDDKPFRGIDEVERRDGHRWELDPESADDGCERGTD
jgi:hypothetical protein